jgi:hypothetical protein
VRLAEEAKQLKEEEERVRRENDAKLILTEDTDVK